jgi:hypothetical protein
MELTGRTTAGHEITINLVRNSTEHYRAQILVDGWAHDEETGICGSRDTDEALARIALEQALERVDAELAAF